MNNNAKVRVFFQSGRGDFSTQGAAGCFFSLSVRGAVRNTRGAGCGCTFGKWLVCNGCGKGCGFFMSAAAALWAAGFAVGKTVVFLQPNPLSDGHPESGSINT